LRILAIASVTLVLHASASLAHEPDAEEIALGSLVDAELAFARDGWERGVHEAFLAHFAADGIAFEPAPVRLRDAWSARPAPADPHAFRLEWKPAQAGVSRSHDFGYTTGPFTAWSVARPDVKRHGVFFSVWQRDAQGAWKVFLDIGVATPSPVDFAALGASPRPHYAGRGNPLAQAGELLEGEANGFGAGANGLTPASYARLLAGDVRLHRDGRPPLASRASVARDTAYRLRRVAWTPQDVRIAPSCDLAVTYGAYRETDRASVVHQGSYAHLWIRDASGDWRLAYDIAHATE
jgi:ketosteroid isomerase-like protein